MFLTKNNTLKWNWIFAGCIITLIVVLGGVFWFDKPLYIFLRQFDTPLWNVIGYVFSYKVWLCVSAVLLLMFYIRKAIESRPRIRNSRNYVNMWVILRDFLQKVKHAYTFYIFCSVLSASVIGAVLKVLIGRMRPLFFELFGQTGFYPLHTEWALNSMPSGHTLASFAGLVVLGMLAPGTKVFMWGLAIIIGVSRVCVGAHWPTDVILGAFIGMVMADCVKAFIKKRLGD